MSPPQCPQHVPSLLRRTRRPCGTAPARLSPPLCPPSEPGRHRRTPTSPRRCPRHHLRAPGPPTPLCGCFPTQGCPHCHPQVVGTREVRGGLPGPSFSPHPALLHWPNPPLRGPALLQDPPRGGGGERLLDIFCWCCSVSVLFWFVLFCFFFNYSYLKTSPALFVRAGGETGGQ